MNEATVTPSGDREIHIERVFNAPRDLVFETMTDPALIPEWWGPREMTTTVDKMDVRVGGEWRFLHRGPDGSDYAFRGEYREIDAPARIVQTFEFEGMPGEAVETMTLEDLGDGRTKVTVISAYDSPEARDGVIASGMEAGLQETYRRLDEVLAKAVAA